MFWYIDLNTYLLDNGLHPWCDHDKYLSLRSKPEIFQAVSELDNDSDSENF